MSLNADQTLGQVVAEHPHAARVFEQAGIDYCCGGQRRLDEACRQSGLSLEQLGEMLKDAGQTDIEGSGGWTTAPLAELVDHIVAKHHAYVRQETPRLQALGAKVRGVHGKNHPELTAVANAFEVVAQEMAMHMMKEERMLFPYIVEMEKASRGESPWPRAPFGSVQNPVQMMMMEHDSAGGTLRGIRELTGDYAVPSDACASYRAFFEGLAQFEADLHQHVHLENNILFPRAVELEEQGA